MIDFKLDRYISVSILLLSLFIGKLNATDLNTPLFHAAPSVLDNVSYDMKTAGYWIARHPYPDSLILTNLQIDDYNIFVQSKGMVTDLLKHDTVYFEPVMREFAFQQLNDLRKKILYDSTGTAITSDYWDKLQSIMSAPDTVKDNQVKFGFSTSFAHQRVLPTEDNINSRPLDIEFDELQNSGYDIGTPHVFYFYSSDKKWIFGATSTSIGWYRVQDVTFCDYQSWKDYLNVKSSAVITSAKADVWLDEALLHHAGFLRMGCKLPVIGKTNTVWICKLPLRLSDGSFTMQTVYIAIDDASFGYLEYTPRNVYNQAFKLLNTAYGWGDMNGDWDCSSLLKTLFATFGINLPRNGKSQLDASRTVFAFSEADSDSTRMQQIAQQGIGAITLLRLSGHIMLYLGSINGNSYALHDIWGFRRYAPDADEVYVINKTVVSTLDLGKGSRKGSLLHRLTHFGLLR